MSSSSLSIAHQQGNNSVCESVSSNETKQQIYVIQKNCPKSKKDINVNNLMNSNSFQPRTNFRKIPINSSNHPLEQSILQCHREKIGELFQCPRSLLYSNITDMAQSPIPTINHSSFHQLLMYGSPINDSVIQTFLSFLCKSNPNIFSLDTNFHSLLCSKGWESAFKFFFLHDFSSCYAKRPKPSQHYYPP